MGKLKHSINLALFLFAIWLLLSGHYTPLLILFGVLSSLVVVVLAARADLIDREIQPVLYKTIGTALLVLAGPGNHQVKY